MLKLYFLGKANFEYDGEDITERFGNKTIALVCLLILNQKKYLSREKIITYLWPDSNEDAAKYNLRFNIWMIKKNIGTDEKGEEFLYVDKERCGINEKYIFWCDISEIMRFRPGREDSLERLLTLRSSFAGDFMEGCYFNNCNDFNEIIILERTHFEDLRVKILKRLAELYEADGCMEQCEEILKEILDIEPYDEDMALKMIRLYVNIGKRSKAIIYYNTFRNRLAGGLGIEPSEKLRRAYEDIKAVSAELVVQNLTEKMSQRKNARQKVIRKRNSPDTITLHTGCIGQIKYFWMADVLDQLAACSQLACSSYLSQSQLQALAYIEPEFAREIGSCPAYPVPDVRIVRAFIRLINAVCRDWNLVIKVCGEAEMDDVSKLACKFLLNEKIDSLHLM